jgi:hypothetical protein
VPASPSRCSFGGSLFTDGAVELDLVLLQAKHTEGSTRMRSNRSRTRSPTYSTSRKPETSSRRAGCIRGADWSGRDLPLGRDSSGEPAATCLHQRRLCDQGRNQRDPAQGERARRTA